MLSLVDRDTGQARSVVVDDLCPDTVRRRFGQLEHVCGHFRSLPT
ncbi:hypothetical protein [Methylobacterium iners]